MDVKFIDTVPRFIDNFDISIDYLRSYYAEYPEIFHEYFAYHCKNTDERLNQSIAKYPQSLTVIKEVHQNIVPIIQEITEQYKKLYHVSFPIEVQLIVGGYGSNAYTHRQIIPNITFALEKLSPEPDHLRTIVAHEFGHATHNILTDQSGTDWGNIQWNNPLTWLNQEGAATHFSRQTAMNLHPSIYYSFNDEGHEWFTFAEANKVEIKKAYAKDYSDHTPVEIFREWFSINGGQKYGHSRLGYYIGNLFFQDQITKLGEMEAIIAWKENDFIEKAQKWLEEEIIQQ
jgi:hypothetical protein